MAPGLAGVMVQELLDNLPGVLDDLAFQREGDKETSLDYWLTRCSDSPSIEEMSYGPRQRVASYLVSRAEGL